MKNSDPLGSLFSCHRRLPLPHDLALDTDGPGRAGGASSAARPLRVPEPVTAIEAINEYKQPACPYKGPPERSAREPGHSGGISGSRFVATARRGGRGPPRIRWPASANLTVSRTARPNLASSPRPVHPVRVPEFRSAPLDILISTHRLIKGIISENAIMAPAVWAARADAAFPPTRKSCRRCFA